MTAILNAQEAFSALQDGKTVLCRHITGEFDALDQFPATVFFMQNYEFCVKIEMLELAGISFTKPLTVDEYKEGQEVFVISTYAPSIYVLNFKTAALIDSINAGFVQRDAENAKLQLQALSKALGREIECDLNVTRLGSEPKKTKRKNKEETKITAVDDEISEDLAELSQKSTVTLTKDDKCQLVIDAINVCNSNNEIDDVLHNLSTYEFNNEQLMLIEDARRIKSACFSETDPELANFNDNHQQILDDLVDRASKAQSPAEANALFKYTKGWTQEQSAPLHAAVSRRLQELPQPEVKELPSLLVRIQKAADLTELDALENDVSARDPKIVPTLMSEVKKRRAQLEAPIDLIDEAFP